MNELVQLRPFGMAYLKSFASQTIQIWFVFATFLGMPHPEGTMADRCSIHMGEELRSDRVPEPKKKKKKKRRRRKKKRVESS
jgi:hypothetical protein